MKMENNKKIFFIFVVLLSIFAIFSSVKADCVAKDWYTCEGSNSAHYTIDTDCNTYSSTLYCDYGCSGGYCQSAPTQTSTYYPTYSPTYYPTYSPTYYPTYSPTYYPTYYSYCYAGYTNNYQCSGNELQRQYQNSDCSTYWQNVQPCSNGCSYNQCNSGCSAQFLNNYQCNGNQIQQQFQNSDCSTTWRSVFTCSSGCYNNGQCVSTSTSTVTSTSTSTVTSPPSCTMFSTGAFRCLGNDQQVQYQFADCSLQWVTNFNCPNGCSSSNGQCISTSTSTSTFTQTIYPQNYYPTGYQILPYQYQYQYLSNPCSAGITNNYQCSGNVRQVQYQNSNCGTTWQNVETCPNGCSNGVCTTSSSISTVTTVIKQQFYFSNLWIIVLIFGVIVLFVIAVKMFGADRPRRDYHREPEFFRFFSFLHL
jgi:hypothetical protein